nr:putative hydrolase [Megavirus caiporensis]
MYMNKNMNTTKIMNKGKEKLTDAELEAEYEMIMRIERQKQMQKQMKKKIRENLSNAINNNTHYKIGSSSSSSSGSGFRPNYYEQELNNDIRQNLNLFSEIEKELDKSRNSPKNSNSIKDMNYTHMCIYSAPKKLLELRGINDTECSIGHDGTRCSKCYTLNTYGKCPYGHIKESNNTNYKPYKHPNTPKNTQSTNGYTNSKTYDICNKCGQEKYKTYRQTQMPTYLKTYEIIVCPNNCESK